MHCPSNSTSTSPQQTALSASQQQSPSQATSVIVSAPTQHQPPHTTYSINGILGIDGQQTDGHNGQAGQRVKRTSSKVDKSDHDHAPTNNNNGLNGDQSESDASGHKRRSSLNPAAVATGPYNGISNDGLAYLAWSAPYDTDNAAAAAHHYESTSLYTPPALGKLPEKAIYTIRHFLLPFAAWFSYCILSLALGCDDLSLRSRRSLRTVLFLV